MTFCSQGRLAGRERWQSLVLLLAATLAVVLFASRAHAQLMSSGDAQQILEEENTVFIKEDLPGLVDDSPPDAAQPATSHNPPPVPEPPQQRVAASDRRTNHWAVVVGGSRYFFNYRHTANALTFYHLLRHHGIDDDHILLFLSDAFACDPRNPFPASVYSTAASRNAAETVRLRNDPVRRRQDNLYGCSAQVDYAGDDVDVRRFLNVLQGRYDANTPPTRRLLSDENSNILIFISGHGAKSNFKFQDSEFLSSSDISETLSMMHAQRRYNKILFLADTCHAISLCESIRAPNVVCLASADAEHDSYSSNHDLVFGMQLTSRWTYEALKLLEGASCSDPKQGALIPQQGRYAGQSALFHSLYEFTYSKLKRTFSGTRSAPAHRGAVNDPQAIHRWTVADFLCGSPTKTSSIDVQYDLL